MTAFSIDTPLGDAEDEVPITLRLAIPGDPLEVRYAYYADGLRYAQWKPYSTRIDWYGRGEDLDHAPHTVPKLVHLEVRDKDGSISSHVAEEPARQWVPFNDVPFPPTPATFNTDLSRGPIELRFDTWHERVWAYGYGDDGERGNLFTPAQHFVDPETGNGYIGTDETLWDLDVPDGDTTLVGMLYWNRLTQNAPEGNVDSVDLSGATISIDLQEGLELDAHGADLHLWITSHAGRWHYLAQPLVVGDGEWVTNRIELVTNGWQQSWARKDSGPIITDVPDLAAVQSLGIGYWDAPETEGQILMDNLIIAPPVRNEIIHGTDGADSPRGGAGDDWFISSLGADIYTGRAGTDTIDYYKGPNIGVRVWFGNVGEHGRAEGDLWGSIENVRGTPADDEIFGDHEANRFWGYSGDDQMLGDAGDDHLDGGPGDDWLHGGEGADILIGGPGADRLAGTLGNDTFLYENATDSTELYPDTILDWREGDLIDLSALGETSFEIVPAGDDWLLSAGDLEIRLWDRPADDAIIL